MNNKYFNPHDEAINIITTHTLGFIQSTEYIPESHNELYETMATECAHILVEDWLDGKYSPMEYNAVRNELASILWGQFEDTVATEMEAKLNA